ncbi:MAG: chromosome segregation protein SMC [Ruminococcus sp.]|nr:chromosome segregation protein SMC [Ruminococcus sp.]
MYLRSLELQGFKSFPDKIKLEFNEGISAVVGPNGSGKSNIGDAMRWVMGEQSSKTLRGGKMEDVIFHGTKSRPAAGFAQVTLNIYNSDNALHLDSSIVSVSRKLYRNGESEYMINGNIVRLKDVVELFMDTGLGRDGYSIIGQGRIADIVSSKSTERREIFEEAAGISKFRYKKEEAERKLKAAEDNISRLTDILTEIEDRIGPLEKQCEKAKKFKVLYDRKKELEISVWVTELHRLEKSLEESRERAELLNTQYSEISDEADRLAEQVELTREKSSEKSVLIDELKESIHQIELDNSQADLKIAVLETDIKHIESSAEEIRTQIEQSESSKYFLEAELEAKNKEIAELELSYAALGTEITDKEQVLSKLSDRSESFDRSLSDASQELNALYIRRSELSYKLESSKNALSDAQEKLASLVEDREDVGSKAQLAAAELKNTEAQRDKTAEVETELQNKLAGIGKLLENKKAKLEKAEQLFDEHSAGLMETEQKLRLLRDLENSMEGFAFSVKTVLTAAKQGRINGVCGSVAQLITVPADYTTAIETALGAALQNIVVESEDSAKRGIRILKEAKAGRATFLPLTSVKVTELSDVPREDDGFVAVASELVSCDDKYRIIVDHLLGRICIAEDLDCAVKTAKRAGYKFKIVTLDGQVINAGGSFTGGSVSKSTGILSRKNEIEKLAAQREKLSEQYASSKEEKEKLIQETAKLAADTEGVKEQLAEVSKELVRLDMDLKRITEFSERHSEQLEQIDSESERLTLRLTLIQNDIDEVNSMLASTDKQIAEGEEAQKSSQSELESMKSEREALSQLLSELRIKQTELAKDSENCALAAQRLKDSISVSGEEKDRLLARIEQFKADIAAKNDEIEAVRKGISESGGKIEEIRGQIAVAQKEHLELENSASLIRQEEKLKLDEKEKLSNEMNRLEERIKSGELEFDRLSAKLFDDHELTLSEAEKSAAPVENMGQANKELAELRGRISALGHVNLGAIEEYAEVSERYEFMKHQLGDVTKSKHELEGMISDLTVTMQDMFVESFEKINNNFKQIFTELFGGGHGELVLSDPDDVLECGIEIKVEPPGKIIKNLLSLSGGEQAFVAVCIYFSILKIRPSPFCVLDEIEAALDDSNVVRYAKYLHRFTDTTQFIAITHRRGTMEEADVLYGVTMQEEGISKLLKMDPGETVNIELDEKERRS